MCLWGKIARAIYDIEEATSTAFDIILDHKVNTYGVAFILFYSFYFLSSACI